MPLPLPLSCPVPAPRCPPSCRDTLGLRRIPKDDFASVPDLGGIKLRLTTVKDQTPSPNTALDWQVPDIVAAPRALVAMGVSFNIYPGFGQDDLGIWTSPDGAVRVNWFNDTKGNALSLTQC